MTPTDIFVFGSNLSGAHGSGAARAAREHHGAIWGQGYGFMGTSYAIPTKDENIETMSLERIECFVKDFLLVAKEHWDVTFNVTRIGCGLAGYTNEDIAPMFAGAPFNCNLPVGWRTICGEPETGLGFDQ